MNVTFLNEAVQIGKLSDLPAYLKSIRDPRFNKIARQDSPTSKRSVGGGGMS